MAVNIEGRWKLLYGSNPEPEVIELIKGVCIWDGKAIGPYSFEGNVLEIEKSDRSGTVVLKSYEVRDYSMSGAVYYGPVGNKDTITEAATLYRI